MRRRVLHDASPAARAAAAVLVSDFDVAELRQGLRGPAVLLVGGSSGDTVLVDDVRVIGVVEPAALEAPPKGWYALVPDRVPRPVLSRVVENAFADIEAGAEIRRLGRELAELNAIGVQLSSERNPDVLLDTILTKAREITRSDAGSLYLVEEAADEQRRLRFALAQNDSLDVPFQSTVLPLSSDSLAGHVALTGQIVNLEDAYAAPGGAPYRFNRSFDERFGYRTRSMLVVPMRTPKGETIGALQLINRKPEFRGPLASPADVDRHVRPFTQHSEKLASSLASQAAVAVENNRLYESIRRLFEGFVQAAVTAIESRDPTTSGHSFRVAQLTTGLAEIVDRSPTGPYGPLHFTRDQMMELRYASLLHDFGKVGVREDVLVKAKKLYPLELERIRHRVAFIKRGLELRYAHRKVEHLRMRGRRGYDRYAAALDAELAAALAELDESLDRVVLANEPAVLPRDVAAEIERLAGRSFEDHEGRRQPLLTPEEAAILSIRRGSLTAAEYQQIQSHVIHTYQFLSQIPWTRELRRIPEIARSHHEKLDGTGYPYAMQAADIPVQSRMMTIADIYDALTAADRPYKKALPVEAALDILRAEQRRGSIDGALLDLFIDARVFERQSSDAGSSVPSGTSSGL